MWPCSHIRSGFFSKLAQPALVFDNKNFHGPGNVPETKRCFLCREGNCRTSMALLPLGKVFI